MGNGYDTLIVHKYTACRVLHDTLIIEVYDCNQPCGDMVVADFLLSDSVLMLGDSFYIQDASVRRSCTLGNRRESVLLGRFYIHAGHYRCR